jgi:serine/threonine protein kinase
MALPSLKRFTVRRQIGEGGMGVVYEAYDEKLRTPVALKTLSRFDGARLARFKQEFRALQGIAHPNLVALDELFVEDGQWFFTMELLEGKDFVSHVRGTELLIAFDSTVVEHGQDQAHASTRQPPPQAPSGSFDEGLLREALRQLLEGLAALHAAGRVHRDVKPSNVLVTRQGRVVLLDFGLVTEAMTPMTAQSLVVGTPAYMAPEQAASREVGPAADLYSVGVVLYEALTGVLPVTGTAIQMLIAKQEREPPRASTLVAGVPEDLDALCAALLRFDPAKRPSAHDVLRSKMMRAPARPGSRPLFPSSNEAPTFVGRGEQLEALRRAFEVTRRGGVAKVLVCGESGIGKSFLVKRFTSDVAADPSAVLLEGRCYEREAVPYKAVDGIIDSLTRRLARLPAKEVETLLPSRAATLGQVFPVMLRVPAIASRHAALGPVAEPRQVRQQGFAALRELFDRIAVRQPTILAIDDLQWADEDGLRALAEMLRPPLAPPLLLIGTVRVNPADAGATLGRLKEAIGGDVQVIEVTSLPPGEAQQLAATLLRKADASGTDPAQLVAEAGGHPLFLEELARHASLGQETHREVKLDDAIWTRVRDLEPAARTVAEIVAVAGKPLATEVVAAAANLEPGELARRTATLRAANLVRSGGGRWSEAIEPYHDRVREAVLAQLDPERTRRVHEALAIAYEAGSHKDVETLAAHWHGAGNAARAAHYGELAGDEARSALAFDRAARWYDEALALVPDAPAARRGLCVKMGDALSYAGRGARAAPYLEEAADLSPPAEAIDLRRRAAEQLLRSGHFDRGIAASRAALAQVGMSMPSTRLATVMALVFYRAWLTVRGLGFKERPNAELAATELARVDTCYAMGAALGPADHFVGLVFSTRAMILALAAGQIDRVTRSLGIEISFAAAQGRRTWKRTERLIALLAELAARTGTTQARFYCLGCTGIGLYFNGRFRQGAASMGDAIALQREASLGLVYDEVTTRMFRTQALAFAGDYAELRRVQEDGLADAAARGDVYASVTLRIGMANLVWLMEDRPDEAEARVNAALAEWSKSGLHLEHFYGQTAVIAARLYAGDGAGAAPMADALLAQMRASLYWRLQTVRHRTLFLRGASALLAAAAGGPGRHGALRDAEQAAAALAKERTGWIEPFATALRAGVALGRGQRDAARATLDAAARELKEADLLGYAAAAQIHLGKLRDDAEATRQRSAAEEWLRAQGVAAPDRFARMLLPGFG